MALRDPDKTRSKILDVAAANFHEKGFQGTSLSDILQQAGISKGALYHHFTNKQELLYAVFDEVYERKFLSRWLHTLHTQDPIEAIAQTVENISNEGSDEEMCLGCPVHNVAAELASNDENIRARVEGLYTKIQDIVAQGVELAIDRKLIDDTTNGTITIIHLHIIKDIFIHLGASNPIHLSIYISLLRYNICCYWTSFTISHIIIDCLIF